MIRHKAMFKGFFIITALCLGTLSEAGNTSIWYDDKVAKLFLDCCTKRMANNPSYMTCASSLEEMKTDLLEVAKAMKNNGPTKEDVIKGSMAFLTAKCMSKTGGSSDKKIFDTRNIFEQCYRFVNETPDYLYINEVSDIIRDKLLNNRDPSNGQQPKKETQSDKIAQTGQNTSPSQYKNSPPHQAKPNQEKKQWNAPYDKTQQGQNFQPNPGPSSAYAIPSGTDQQRPTSSNNAYLGNAQQNQLLNPLNTNYQGYPKAYNAYLWNPNQNQLFNPSNRNNQQGNPNVFQTDYQNTPASTSASAASQTAYNYHPQNYDYNPNSYPVNAAATSSASASGINYAGNNAASSSSGHYSIDSSNKKSSSFNNNKRKGKQNLPSVKTPQSGNIVSPPQKEQKKWDNNQNLHPVIQNTPITKPETVKTSSVPQQTSPFAPQNVAQDNNLKINSKTNVPSAKDDKDARALRFSKTLYEIFIHDVFFKIVFHEYLTKYQSKTVVPYIVYKGFSSCGYDEKTAQECATKSISVMDGFPEQSSTLSYAEGICKMVMMYLYEKNLIDNDSDGQATDLGKAMSKALGEIVSPPPDQDNDPKPVVLPVSKQPLPDYLNKGIPYDDSNPIYDAAKPQVKPDSFSNKQKPVVLPEFEKNLPDYLKEFVPYDDNNLNYDVANTEVKPDSFSDTPVDLPAYEQNSPDYPITSVHYDDGNPNYDAANPKVKPDSFSNKQLNKKSDLLIKGSDYSLPQTLPIQNQKNRPKVYDISNQPTDDKVISYYKPEKNKNKNKADQSYVVADDKTGYGSDYNDDDVSSGQWQYQKQKNRPNNKGNSDQSPDDKPISYDKTSKNKSNKKDKTVYSSYNDKNQPTNNKQNKKKNQQIFGSTDSYGDNFPYYYPEDDYYDYFNNYPEINAEDDYTIPEDLLDYQKRKQSQRKDYNVNDNSKDTPEQREDTLIQKADTKNNKQGDNNPDTYNVPDDNSKTIPISKTLKQYKNKSNSLYLPDYDKDGGQKPSKQPSLLPPIADDQQNSKLSDIAQKNISKAPVKPETLKNSDLAHTPDNQTDLGTGAPGFQTDNSMNPDLNKAKNEESKASVEILKKSALDCMKGEEFDYKTFSHVIAELAKILQQNHPDWGKQECQKTVLIQALYVLAQLLLKSNVKEVKGILQQPQKIFEPMQLPPNSQQNNQNEPQKDQNPNYQPGQTNKKSQPVIQDKPTVDYLAPEQNIAYSPQNQELQQKKWDNNPNSYSVIPNTPTPQQKPVNANYVPQQTNPSANQPSAQNNNWYITNQEWQSSLPQRNNNNEYSPLRGQQDPVPGQVNLNPGNGKWNDKLFSAPQTGNSNIPYPLQNQQIQPNRLDSNKNSYPVTQNTDIPQQKPVNTNYVPQQTNPSANQLSAQNSNLNIGNKEWQNNPRKMNSNNVNSPQFVQQSLIPGQINTIQGNGKWSDKIFSLPQPMNGNFGVPDVQYPTNYQANWPGLQQKEVNNPILPQNRVQGNWYSTPNGPNIPTLLQNRNPVFNSEQGNRAPIPNGPSSPRSMQNGYPGENQGIGSVSQTDVSSQMYQWNRNW